MTKRGSLKQVDVIIIAFPVGRGPFTMHQASFYVSHGKSAHGSKQLVGSLGRTGAAHKARTRVHTYAHIRTHTHNETQLFLRVNYSVPFVEEPPSSFHRREQRATVETIA